MRLVKYGGLLLACAVAVLLSTGARAQAAECVELEECHTAGTWQKAVSDDYSNKAAWFRATSRQNFIYAYEWNQKAAFAFHAGDATAAAWYKALADDYSRKSVADARAADDYANQALFWAVAADNSFRRYLFIANSPDDGAGIPIAKRKDGVSSLDKAKVICRRHWAGRLVCDSVVSKTIEGAVRWVWKMVGGSTCLRQEARAAYINPSTGYVERIEHVCVKWA